MSIEILATFIAASFLTKIMLMIFLEYKCKAPRVAFFWGGMLLGWIDVFTLFFILLDFSFDAIK